MSDSNPCGELYGCAYRNEAEPSEGGQLKTYCIKKKKNVDMQSRLISNRLYQNGPKYLDTG